MENGRGPSWRHAIAIGAILVIFSILLCGCDDEPQPDFSPLTIAEPAPVGYMNFSVPDWYDVPITGTVTLTRELRLNDVVLATRSTKWQQRLDGEAMVPAELEPSWPVAVSVPVAEFWRGYLTVNVEGITGVTFTGVGYDANSAPILPDDTGAYRMVEIEVNSYFLPIIFK